MSQRIVDGHTITTCDGCRGRRVNGHLADEGWSVNGDQHMCPKCKPALLCPNCRTQAGNDPLVICGCGYTAADAAAEIAALRAEVERLRDLHDANEIETRRLIRERDEARDSLASASEARNAERLRGDRNLFRADAAESECARLRAEGERAEARGFAAGAEAARGLERAARSLCDAAVRAHPLPPADKWFDAVYAAIRALRSPPPATGPAPTVDDLHGDCMICGHAASKHPPDGDKPWTQCIVAGCPCEEYREAPRSSAEDAAHRCAACLEQPYYTPCSVCHGTGRSPSTERKDKP